jgi:hypothetical protein
MGFQWMDGWMDVSFTKSESLMGFQWMDDSFTT